MLEQAASEPSSNGQSARTALITGKFLRTARRSSANLKFYFAGAGGQDGSYLVELLLRKGYQVHVLVRQPESINGRWYRDVYKGMFESDALLRPRTLCLGGPATSSTGFAKAWNFRLQA